MIVLPIRKSTVLFSVILCTFLSGHICAGTEDPLFPVDSLEVCYKFDSTEGNVAIDSSGKDRDGTLINMSDDDWVPGYHGNALSFDGSNDYVSVTGYKGILGQAPRTIAAWVKTDTVGGFVSWGFDVRAGKYVFGIRDNRVAGAIRIEINGGYHIATTDIRDNQWHHVAVVLDSDDKPDVIDTIFYLDGKKEIISDDKPYKIDTTEDWDVNVGRALRTGRHFRGLMDDVCIFSTALSEQEIVQLAILGPDSLIQPCGLLNHPELKMTGDINRDCNVDINDFAILAANWMETGLIPGQIELDDTVNHADLALMAQQWLNTAISDE